MKKTLAFGIVLVLLLAGVGAVSAANLVQNPGFEIPDVPSGDIFIPGVQGTTMDFWNIEAGDIEIIDKSYWQPNSGDQSIDLTGVSKATMSQTLTTDPSKTYKLSFMMSGNPDPGEPRTTRTVEVYWDDALKGTYSFDIEVSGSSFSDMKWKLIEIPNLKATSSHTTIKFKDISPTVNPCNCVGVALDDIVVDYESMAAPEFPSLFLPATMIIGFLGAVLLLQRTREH